MLTLAVTTLAVLFFLTLLPAVGLRLLLKCYWNPAAVEAGRLDSATSGIPDVRSVKGARAIG
jgi:hypothetical protein